MWMQMKRSDAAQAAHADVQEKVGIWNRRQCSRTVSHLADMEPKRERCPERSCQKVTLCVEGNISAGKSTFLEELLKSSVELRDIVEVSIPCCQGPHCLVGCSYCNCTHRLQGRHTELPSVNLHRRECRHCPYKHRAFWTLAKLSDAL